MAARAAYPALREPAASLLSWLPLLDRDRNPVGDLANLRIGIPFDAGDRGRVESRDGEAGRDEDRNRRRGPGGVERSAEGSALKGRNAVLSRRNSRRT
ncbi:MAG: hypothetical protein CME06_03670 [Gemmatimonadetes bacterium]|nr:hypothetical protein [Gemmatimonadota bacterium]